MFKFVFQRMRFPSIEGPPATLPSHVIPTLSTAPTQAAPTRATPTQATLTQAEPTQSGPTQATPTQETLTSSPAQLISTPVLPTASVRDCFFCACNCYHNPSASAATASHGSSTSSSDSYYALESSSLPESTISDSTISPSPPLSPPMFSASYLRDVVSAAVWNTISQVAPVIQSNHENGSEVRTPSMSPCPHSEYLAVPTNKTSSKDFDVIPYSQLREKVKVCQSCSLLLGKVNTALQMRMLHRVANNVCNSSNCLALRILVSMWDDCDAKYHCGDDKVNERLEEEGSTSSEDVVREGTRLAIGVSLMGIPVHSIPSAGMWEIEMQFLDLTSLGLSFSFFKLSFAVIYVYVY